MSQSDLPMCQCQPPRPFGEAKTAGPSTKNPGRQFYKCDACNTFTWVDQYGKARSPFKRARDEVYPAQSDLSSRLGAIETKIDQLMKHAGL